MKKIGLLFTSRNNYEMIDFWMEKIDLKELNLNKWQVEAEKEKIITQV